MKKPAAVGRMKFDDEEAGQCSALLLFAISLSHRSLFRFRITFNPGEWPVLPARHTLNRHPPAQHLNSPRPKSFRFFFAFVILSFLSSRTSTFFEIQCANRIVQYRVYFAQ